MHWFIGAVGALFSSLGLLIMTLELLAERQTPAAERDWGAALRRAWGSGHVLVGGFVMIALAVFLVNPDTGFRVLFVPLGAVGATAPLVHLIASWRAERNGSERGAAWQRVAAGSGRVMMSCCLLGLAACALYFVTTTGSKLDGLAQRVRQLEEQRPAGGE